jgi:hypothetical protein
MNHVKIKKDKHLLVFSIANGLGVNQLEQLSLRLKEALGDEFKFVLSQADLTVITVED